VALAELTVSVPTPRVDFAESGAGDRVSESAFDGVDAFTCFFKAGNQFRDVVRISMAESKLTVLVLFAD